MKYLNFLELKLYFEKTAYCLISSASGSGEMALNGKESAVEVQRVLTSREEKEVKEKAKIKRNYLFPHGYTNKKKRKEILRKPPRNRQTLSPTIR